MLNFINDYKKRGFVILNAKEFSRLEMYINGIEVSQFTINEYLKLAMDRIDKLNGEDHDIAMMKHFLQMVQTYVKLDKNDIQDIQKIIE